MERGTTSVDLLIVGAGPAGTSAAAQAAGSGLTVLVVEKKTVLGIPVQCAEFVPAPIAARARNARSVVQQINAMNTHLPSGQSESVRSPGLMIDRMAFDQALAEEARTAGARIETSSSLRGLDPASGVALISQSTSWLSVRFRLLIAADGPNSRVASLLGLPPLSLVQTRQYTVPLTASSSCTDVWLSSAYPGGYGWLFPKGRTANLGVGVDPRLGASAKARLDRLRERLVGEHRIGPGILARSGGPIPVSGLRDALVLGNVLFAGDAAGLTNPITGAGIPAAVASGERAGQAAAEYDSLGRVALQAYDEEIRDQFEASIDRALRKRGLLIDLWSRGMADKDSAARRCWVGFDDYFESDGGLFHHAQGGATALIAGSPR